MIKLILDNVYIKIENIEKDVEMTIWNKLSFEVEEFAQEHVNIRHLYNRKTKKTYTGLLPNIEEILKELDEEYEIIDKRIKHEPNADFKLVDKITLPDGIEVKLELRPYQEKLVKDTEVRSVLQACTGSGKTIMMAALISKYNVKPVSVFADKLSLCSQIKNEFEKFLGVPIGLVGGGINKKEDITVYSIQSTTPEDVKDSKMILFDECLTYYQKVLMANGIYRNIGELVDEKSTEEVVSFNHQTGKVEFKKMTNHSRTLLSDNNKKLMRITIRQGDGSLKTIECTDNHKIWIENQEQYVMIRDLERKEINYVRNNVNEINNIYNIEYINLNEEVYNNTYVYDITVEDNHNFFANDILLSNCHHIPASTCSEVSRNAVNAYYRIGVSATPWRDGGDDLLIEACLSKRKPENNITATKLTELGYLVPATIYFIPIKEMFKGKNYHEVYKNAIVENKERNRAIVKIAKKMHERDAAILILIQRIEHGEILLEMLNKIIPIETFAMTVNDPKNGKPTMVRVKSVEFLSGKDDALRREAVLQAVREKKCRILIGSTIADEGMDAPALNVLILGTGGKSSTRAFQRIGRTLRLYPGKTKATIFDFQDWTPMLRRHSRIREKLYRTEEAWEIKTFNTDLLKK